jgi:phage I-like protein
MSYDDSLKSEQPKGSVTLSADEVAFARSLGISLQEYAKGKIRNVREQANGERQR